MPTQNILSAHVIILQIDRMFMYWFSSLSKGTSEKLKDSNVDHSQKLGVFGTLCGDLQWGFDTWEDSSWKQTRVFSDGLGVWRECFSLGLSSCFYCMSPVLLMSTSSGSLFFFASIALWRIFVLYQV